MNLANRPERLFPEWVRDAMIRTLEPGPLERYMRTNIPELFEEPEADAKCEVINTPTEADVLKLANDAHHRMVEDAEADGGWYGFSHSRDAWENGYATGYWARIHEAEGA